MFEKIIVPVVFLAAQLLISWYSYFAGKLPTKGMYLGFAYDSVIIRSFITQLEYLWVLVLINFLFSIGFQLGFASIKNFLVIAVIWIATAPIAALIFNAIVVKEKLDWAILVGIVFVVLGAVLVVGHKEIVALVK